MIRARTDVLADFIQSRGVRRIMPADDHHRIDRSGKIARGMLTLRSSLANRVFHIELDAELS